MDEKEWERREKKQRNKGEMKENYNPENKQT
jgi:hypothetical protein